MALPQPRYSKEEFARRGDEIYERDVLPGLGPEDQGKFVAIDIETRDYAMAADELSACDLLRSRLSDPQVWLRKVGSRYLYRFGFRRASAA
ncbi:MAG TPA: hypothetical protein VG477_15245 [Thermoanaerobaculia bacterium]|nr:hypothetical protein [Thermoanaerobaculia bacterium]